jgi:uncharacterized protein (PEP-CTERM system associated)
MPTRFSGLLALSLTASVVAAPAGEPPAEEDTRGPPRPYAIDYSISLRGTVTDNGGLSASNKRVDTISEPGLGVRASANSARLKGSLDYSLTGLVYARDSSRDRFVSNLAAVGTAAVIENRAFVDLAASISQQAISAFGVQVPGSSPLAEDNQTQVSTLSVSPYLRGRLAGAAEYEARLTFGGSHGGSASVSNGTSSAAQLRLGSIASQAPLSWSMQLSHSEADYSLGRRTNADVGRGSLVWTVSPQLTFGVIGGAESNNYVSVEKESHSIAGMSVNWRPDERTALAAQGEHRFFGESHALAFSHRTARTAWSYADSRDISGIPGQPVLSSLGSAFDLVNAQFAAIEPDPVLRSQLVNQFLQTRGIDPRLQLYAAFPTSAVIVQRVRNLSAAWIAARDTLTLTLSQTDSHRLDTVNQPRGDFSLSSDIQQRGVSLNGSHLLTPRSSISLIGSYQRTSGTLQSLTTSLKSLAALWTSQIGRHTDASLGARHAVFGSTTSPYEETSVSATIRLRF